MDKVDGYDIQNTIRFKTGYGFALGCVAETSADWNFMKILVLRHILK